MKLIFTVARIGDAFNELTRAAREYVPSQLRSGGEPAAGIPQLVNAAVRFTCQLAIEVEHAPPEGHVRDLESALIAKLATWVSESGEMTLRLWTHDMSGAFGALMGAAYYYAHPHSASVKYVIETLPRNLTIAAVAFTIQLALEETALPAVAMRGVESALIRELEAPWEFGEIPLSVDVQDGPTWESLSSKE